MKFKYYIKTGDKNYHKLLKVPTEIKSRYVTKGDRYHLSNGTYTIDDITDECIYITFEKE